MNADRDEIRDVMDEMNILLYREEMMWMQRSRVDWLKEGDRNTKFFHSKVVWRARKNNVMQLIDDHAITLGLHTTTLILVKGALDARGSKLMPDKKDFGYSFPCDGPGRGGTCCLGHILFGSFLDVKYHWMGYFLLALETYHIMGGQRFTI
jgi:hypothetical protein